MTAVNATLLGTIAPATPRPLHAALAVLGGAVLIAASTRVQVPMWPVPMTLQTLAVLIVAMTMGARLATGAVASYLAAGAAGLPVFASGGGVAYLTGPTAGYLLGFLVVASVVGALADRGFTRHLLGALALAGLGSLLVYVCGVAWLSTFVGLESAVRVGVLPFLPGDVVKSAIAALMLPAAWSLMTRLQ